MSKVIYIRFVIIIQTSRLFQISGLISRIFFHLPIWVLYCYKKRIDKHKSNIHTLALILLDIKIHPFFLKFQPGFSFPLPASEIPWTIGPVMSVYEKRGSPTPNTKLSSWKKNFFSMPMCPRYIYIRFALILQKDSLFQTFYYGLQYKNYV